MELQINKVGLESGGIFQGEESFGIGDAGFLMGVLRKQLYSNPIKAICQEYSSNGRDANREVGKAEVPIRITLPHAYSPEWKCRDFGPGISPERISKVFLLMGNSTKRSDNHQTGGFGIGAKCAFGYADQWSVTTYIDGIKRLYIATITDDGRGKLVLFSTETTSEPNGTEIAVPVGPGDFHRFRTETVKATQNWEVHPVITDGTELTRFRSNAILSGESWFVTRGSNGREYVALVDGIEYPISIEQFTHEERGINFSYGTRACFEFKTGEVNVAISREQLEYNAFTRKALVAAFKKMEEELLQQVEKEIADSSSYIRANLKSHEIVSRLGIGQQGSLTWKGFALFGGTVRTEGLEVMPYYVGTKATKALRSSTNYLPFEENVVYAWYDKPAFDKLADNAALAIGKAFPNASKVILVRKSYAWEKDAKKIALSEMGFVDASAYYSAKQRKQSLGRLTIYKYNGTSFSRTSLEEYESTDMRKAWCLLKKKARQNDANVAVMQDGGCFAEGRLQEVLKAVVAAGEAPVALFAFSTEIPQEKYEELTDEMYHVSEILSETVSKLDCIPELLWYDDQDNSDVYGAARVFDNSAAVLNKLQEAGLDKTVLAGLLQESLETEAKIERVSSLVPLIPFINNKGEITRKDFVEELEKKKMAVISQYPLLKYATFLRVSYCYNTRQEFSSEEIVEYVRMMELVGLSPALDMEKLSMREATEKLAG